MRATSASQVHALADQVGEFIQYWGFKRVHGRIWAHLFLSELPLDAGTLIKRLGVSKALMSLSLNELLQYQVIRRSGKSSEGTLLYVANPDVTGVILNVLKVRERKMLESIESSFEGLEGMGSQDIKRHHLSEQRIQAVGELIRTGRKTLESFLSLSKLDLAVWKQFQDA